MKLTVKNSRTFGGQKEFYINDKPVEIDSLADAMVLQKRKSCSIDTYV
ncbi:hypothetical protein D922_02422 [Enterococcus faecalis 06-MB-DW-09]|nr:hypothetical protein D922_02422 [Enterococcus faecalis 06-MB-DW-09]